MVCYCIFFEFCSDLSMHKKWVMIDLVNGLSYDWCWMITKAMSWIWFITSMIPWNRMMLGHVFCQVYLSFDEYAWWPHQMETFSALLTVCAGNSLVTGEFPTQRPVIRSFDVFFELHLNIRLSKQWWGWWFEMPSRPLWRHSNDSMSMHHCCGLHDIIHKSTFGTCSTPWPA